MLKWAVTSRGSPTSTSGVAGTRPGGEIENYMSASRAGAWPTYSDVRVAQPSETRCSPQWMMEDSDDDDRDSLSAYNDNTSTLEQMMTIDFNDDSQVLFTVIFAFLPRCIECRRGLAMRIMSVRLSVKRMDCDKTEEQSVQIFIPYERTFSLVF